MEQIGEGGMGVVYVAEQTKPVRRKVALKIIKPGTDTQLGAALAGEKKYAEAQPLLLQGYQGPKDREAKIPAPHKEVGVHRSGQSRASVPEHLTIVRPNFYNCH
jgi:hypothetical protein